MKFSDALVRWLHGEGYTHCFFVAGGNIMHLLNSSREVFTCVPFVHEVSAGIAVEYFNEANTGSGKKAFALVTAGPGLTNLVTALSGAWLESRELLAIGGQVKTSDSKDSGLRQRGIQEIDGVAITESITKRAVKLTEPIGKSEFIDIIQEGGTGRKGPVFIELPLDVQGAPPVESKPGVSYRPQVQEPKAEIGEIESVAQGLRSALRPVLLVGGGVKRSDKDTLLRSIEAIGIPVMTTWNGADLIPSNHPMYWGRPNTWGQRFSNVLIQQSDYVIALGTRLGLQQTGFAWEEFGPLAQIVHVDIDEYELRKGHPVTSFAIKADAISFLTQLSSLQREQLQIEDWLSFGNQVKDLLPISEVENSTRSGFINPYEFILSLSEALPDGTNFIPASSGGAFTVSMQAFSQKPDQVIISNKGLASMGYGTAGAIGAAMARPDRLTVLVEGDGGFAQNLQELGTVASQNLNLKIFVFSNEGYASIRMTQRNYFNGAWIGCDTETGLGLPNLELLARTYGIPFTRLVPGRDGLLENISACLSGPGPLLIEVPIDPEQTYFPKISSRIGSDGKMTSNPLHLMDPPLSHEKAEVVLKYLDAASGGIK